MFAFAAASAMIACHWHRKEVPILVDNVPPTAVTFVCSTFSLAVVAFVKRTTERLMKKEVEKAMVTVLAFEAVLEQV